MVRDDEQLDEGEAACAGVPMPRRDHSDAAASNVLTIACRPRHGLVYRTVTVTGLNCSGTGAPSGVLATPLT